MAVLFPRMDKGDLRCNVLGTAQRIGGKGFFKVCIAVGCVVEAGNGFVKGRGRIICQLVLEFAQGLGNSAEVGLAAHLLQADGVLHKIVGAPRAALGIQMAGRAGQGGDHVQGLPCRVAACGKDLFPQMPGHAADVVHQAHRVGKGVGVDALQDKALGVVLPPDHEGIVDVAFAVVTGIADHRPAKIKGICGGAENGFGNRFHFGFLISYPSCRLAGAGRCPCRT